MEMNQFDRHILNYCKLHPDDALSHFVKCYKESSARKKAKRKKWSLIGEHYESRGDIEKEAKTLEFLTSRFVEGKGKLFESM